MPIRSLCLLLLFALAASAHAARHVVFVDNRYHPGGAGSQRQPFGTLEEAVAANADVIYVAETGQPYTANINLRRGQLLIGSAYGLDVLRAERQMEFDVRSAPAVQGPGPLIEGSVTMGGDNIVAGLTIATAAVAAISAASPAGPITVINTYIRTSGSAPAASLSNIDSSINFTGGGVTSAGGAGIMMYGGAGEAIFDRFGLDGTFTTALDLRSRGGKTVFRGKAAIEVAAAAQPAVSITACTAPVEIDIPLRVAAQSRALSIAQSSVKLKGDGNRLSATNAPALEIRDSVVEAAFADVSASGGASGIIADKLRGALVIGGGTIRDTKSYGIDVTQSSGLRLSGITLADNGGPDRAAIHLRHVTGAELENITVAGAKSIGLHASNIENAQFGGLQIRDSGGAAVLLDEVKEKVTFSRCTFENPGGGALVLTQQFNKAAVVLDRCAFSAATKPMGATHLVTLRSSGMGKLEVALRNAELRDNAGSALRAEAQGTGAISLTVADARIERLGRTAIEVAARDSSHVAFVLRGTTIFTPGNTELPGVDVAAASSATACADLIGNQVTIGSGVTPVRLSPGIGACR